MWYNKSLLMVYVKFSPSWKRYERQLREGTPQQQQEAAEKFTAERDHAMKTDPQARRWEESRKRYYAKQKPGWAKGGREI